MVVNRVGNLLVGTAAERLAFSTTNMLTGTRFYETDTIKTLEWNGTSWIPRWLKKGPTQTVFQDGGTTYAQDSNGNIISSSSTVPQTPIQAALDLGGYTFVNGGLYDLTSAFTGFNMTNVPTNDKLELAVDAHVRVPNGYTGVCINVPVLTSGFTLDGGIFSEQGTASRLWTWLRLYGSNNGVYANNFRNNNINDAGIGIKFLTDTTTGWINDNRFDNIKMTGCVVFVDFSYTATWPGTEATGFFNNSFDKVYCQCTTGVTTHGFKDVRHGRNTFVHCDVWDATGSMITANFHTNSSHNVIVGGIMTALNFTDSGTKNKVWDSWKDLTPGGHIDLGTGGNYIKFHNDIILKRHGANFLSVRNAADSLYNSLRVENIQALNIGDQVGTPIAQLAGTEFRILDAKNITFGTATGGKIGTTNTQKIGFFGATPVVQPAANPDTSSGSITTVETEVNQIKALLRSLGLMAP